MTSIHAKNNNSMEIALRDSITINDGIIRDTNFDEGDIETARRKHVDYRSPTLYAALQSTTADSSRVGVARSRACQQPLFTYIPGPRKREGDTNAGSIYRGEERGGDSSRSS